ncbi:MAG: ABC-2 family transporter protein [Calothrix sp. MO_192.B10]|nr:ABC-2 family transporter protein [Calothrix sp. MO_192.B10]
MKRTTKKAFTLLSVYYSYMVEYRAELILWMLSGSLPIILMGIWMQAALGGQFGFTPVEFARYFLAVFLIRQFTVVWVIWEFEKEVVEGKLSPKLLQPLDPVWHHVASHIAERMARLPFAFILIGLFFLLYPQAFWLPNLGNLLLFSLAVTLGFALKFTIQYTFAIFAFWTERASALQSFWMLFYLFLSGLIAPLDIFPQPVKDIVLFTPFPYLINFPATILIGLPVDLMRGFLSVVGWLLLFLGINRWLWRRGLKHYSGMGA